MTWEKAKADAQSMELKIAALVPAEHVLKVDQHRTGSLFRCDESQHQWTGITYVSVTPGTDIERIVKSMEREVAEVFGKGRDAEVTSRRDIVGDYVVTARSLTTGEGYLFGKGSDDTIAIDSWSVCFTLPDGVYPGGDF